MRLVLAHGKRGVVHIKNGNRRGVVHISEGGLVHARVDDEIGEDAFYELSLWKKGRFDFQDTDPGSEHTIHTSARSLLVEASRRLDAWNMISSKVPSFDLVPKWVPLSGAKSIRLTKSDWALIRLVDGRRSIRHIVDAMRTDIFEAGRVVYSLITVGVLRLDEGADPRDEAFDLVAVRGDQISVAEPFQLTAAEWLMLSRVDDRRDLGAIRDSLGVPPPEFMKLVRGLKEKGFLKLTSREHQTRKEA